MRADSSLVLEAIGVSPSGVMLCLRPSRAMALLSGVMVGAGSWALIGLCCPNTVPLLVEAQPLAGSATLSPDGNAFPDRILLTAADAVPSAILLGPNKLFWQASHYSSSL